MVARKVTPTSVVVLGTKVGGRHRHDTAAEAPLGVGLGVAHHLVASPARLAAPEKRAAQRRRVDPEPRVEGVVIATSSSYRN